MNGTYGVMNEVIALVSIASSEIRIIGDSDAAENGLQRPLESLDYLPPYSASVCSCPSARIRSSDSL